MKRKLCFLFLIILALTAAYASGEGFHPCHRVNSTAESTTQKNKSVIRIWHVETALDTVSDEINGIA